MRLIQLEENNVRELLNQIFKHLAINILDQKILAFSVLKIYQNCLKNKV